VVIDRFLKSATVEFLYINTQGGKSRTSVLLKYRSTEKYREVQRSTEKYKEVQRSTEKYREVQRSTEKFREVQRSPKKYKEVQRSTEKYREVQRSTEKYREVPRSTEEVPFFFFIFSRKQNKSVLLLGDVKNSVPNNRTFLFCF
jgi:cell fate (sporulation/competence/biofilm development) regulator YlbF (YheA/YmcA/DUF963 family)